MNHKVSVENYRYWAFSLVATGIFLRAMHYLGGRSLWMDEAKLAVNFTRDPAWDIFQPLLQNQIAPLGFLLIEKLSVGLLGASEYALRLYPFIAGVLSVYLIYRLASRTLGLWIGLIALGIFSVSHWAIYYAAEVKQYSSDMMVALLLYLAAAYALQKSGDIKRWLLLTVAGMAGVLLSHPATFILAGIGISLGLQEIARRQWSNLLRLGASSIVWIGSFAFGLYATSIIASGSGSEGQATLTHMTGVAWTGAFAPFPPTSPGDIRWYSTAFFALFNHPLGFAASGLAAFLFLTGVVYLWRRERLWLGMLVLPMLVTLAASALHLYPFTSRLLVFLVPGTIIVIAAGVNTVRQLAGEHYRFVWILAMAVLLYQPVWKAFTNVKNKAPYNHEDIRTVLNYVGQSMADGDRVYIYAGAASAFRYYQPQLDLPADRIIWGTSTRKSWDAYQADIQELQCFDRVWLVFSHVIPSRKGFDEKRFLLHFLDKVGEEADSVVSDGAYGYLYQFNPDERPQSCSDQLPSIAGGQ